MILPSLIHACDHSTIQNIATYTEGTFIILNNNCSLPPSSDFCHQNGETTFSNTVTCTLKRKFEILILNRLICQKYLWLIDVNFQYQVRPLHCTIVMTKVKHNPHFVLSKYLVLIKFTSHFFPTGDHWCVSCEYFRESWYVFIWLDCNWKKVRVRFWFDSHCAYKWLFQNKFYLICRLKPIVWVCCDQTSL